MINLLNSQIYPRTDTTYPNNNQPVPGVNIDPSEQADPLNESVKLELSPEAQKILKNITSTNTTREYNSSADSKPEVKQPESSRNNPLESKKTAETKEELSLAKLKIVQELRARDRTVRTHEAQHMAVAGRYAVGGPHYSFVTGPDGLSYANGGEVRLDMSPVPNNPEATIAKAQAIRAGALAPANPSGADLSVAATASQMENQARMELAAENQKSLSKEGDTQVNPLNQGNKFILLAYRNILHPGQTGLFFNQSA